LLGERHDVPALAQALDLHVLPSLTEGFPNVVAETMLSSTPNVATDVGDSKLIVAETGWIVSPGDSEQLACAIARAHAEWSAQSESWRQRQATARQRIVEDFSLNRMVDRYEKVWAEAAKRTSGDAPRVAAQRSPGVQQRPLRVLHIINRLTLGGAEALLYRLVTRDNEHEHVVVSLGSPAWYSERLEQEGVRVHHLGIEAAAMLPRGLMRLRRIVQDSGADVVQCWMYHSNFLGGLIAKTAGKPVIWGVHNTSLEPVRPRSRALVYLSGLLAPRAADFIINCSVRSAELHRKLGFGRVRGAVIHNGYDPAAFFPDEAARRRSREELGIGEREFVIGSIARWDALKDIPNLLAALPLARARGVPFRCFLIGAGLGPGNPRLVEEMERLGCADLVVPLGPRPDIQGLARAIDLHVLASRTEAFPNVVAETMLSGTPNVVTDVGDSAVMVGETGWVVPSRDPESLAEAIANAYAEWKDQSADWAERRTAARDRIARNFSIESMAAAYEEIWCEAAGASAGELALYPTAVQ
jgi:glycosyltransferase involved in cell wall biosynthesis